MSYIRVRELLENITWDVEAFLFSPPRIGRIWIPPRIDRMWMPLWGFAESWYSSYVYVHKFFNNTPTCVLWPYLSYFRFFDNYYFAKSGHPLQGLAESGCSPLREFAESGHPPHHLRWMAKSGHPIKSLHTQKRFCNITVVLVVV